MAQNTLEELKKQFLEEIKGVDDIEVLKDIYATQIAKRDQLLAELQQKNEIILKSAFKNKSDSLDVKKTK